ncbi:hypothetical protein [Pseudomonas kitaguniensis]|uniref:hypothetical protein n=1 Tax=Pseudomonas kitaguniensis TaxID=2607908 RepID=UPI0019D522B8|nr:hypothetical protein [Pseudomonas kitaguniensis]
MADEDVFPNFDVQPDFVHITDMVAIVPDKSQHLEFWKYFNIAVENFRKLICRRVQVIQIGKQSIYISVFCVPEIQQLTLAVKISVNECMLLHLLCLCSRGD